MNDKLHLQHIIFTIIIVDTNFENKQLLDPSATAISNDPISDKMLTFSG